MVSDGSFVQDVDDDAIYEKAVIILQLQKQDQKDQENQKDHNQIEPDNVSQIMED